MSNNVYEEPYSRALGEFECLRQTLAPDLHFSRDRHHFCTRVRVISVFLGSE